MWAASRTGLLLDTASQHPFGGWLGGHHRRWQYTSPRFDIITPAIGDGRPTWPQGDTARLSRTNRSTGFRLASGDLGTNAMHPMRKRTTNINKHNQSIFETRGRAKRPSPTQRFSIRHACNIHETIAILCGRTQRHHNRFLHSRQWATLQQVHQLVADRLLTSC